jgi:NADH-quinone oxidoreductase subunit G
MEDVGLAARLASVLGGGELVYRSERAADEIVCPGFPKLARRRDLAANVRGLDIVGFKRVGADDGTGGLSSGGKVLVVVGDELTDVPASFGADADLFIYIGHKLTTAARNAHFVLPATTFAEQEGTFVNFEGRVQRFWPALQGPPLARPAWQILGVLLAGLGDGDAPASAGQAFARPSDLHDELKGLSYELLGSRGAVINSKVKITAGGGEVR